MNRKIFNIGLVISLLMLLMMMSVSLAWAQVSLKDLSVNYNVLRLDEGYAILYDNPNEAAKLSAFKIKFYKDGTFIDETVVETFPLNGTVATYELTDSVVGFNRAELSIISLHAGDIIDFPSSAASIIALNEPKEIEPSSPDSTPANPEPVNTPPLANDIVFEVESTAETLTRSIASEFSDPDDDSVTVVEISKTGPPLSYSLFDTGILTLNAPSVTGNYTIPYAVKDSQGALASADIIINVVFPEDLNSKIVKNLNSIEEFLSQINTQKTQLLNLPAVPEALRNRRENLLADNKALEKHTALKEQTLKDDIANLTVELETSENALSTEAVLKEIEDLNTQSLVLKNTLQALKSQSQEEGVNANTIRASLITFDSNLEELKSKKNAITIPIVLTAAQMDAWEVQHQTLVREVSTFNGRWLLVTLLVLGAIGALILSRQSNLAKTRVNQVEVTPLSNDGSRGFRWLWFPRRPPPRIPTPPQPSNNIDGDGALPPRLEIGIQEGLIIGGGKANVTSQALATTNVEPAFLDDFQQSYNAIGRIGLPFGAEDQRSCGTGVLITPRHIMTNAHVYDFLYEYGQPGEFGIEFMAELGNPASSHYEFEDIPPLILEGFDIAIFTLRTPIDSRLPAVISPAQPQDLEEREIALIGYPSSYSYRENDHFSAFEMFPVLDVKRVSYGSIFRHSEDVGPFGFRVNHHKARNTIIPHNATSIGGGSGSPVIDKETGQVLAIHFGGSAKPEVLEDSDTEDAVIEKANFSMPMSEICDALPEDISKLMTIT